MKRQLALRMVALAVVVVIAFVAGAMVGARGGWLQPRVDVTIQNQTGQTTRDLGLAYESSGGLRGSVSLPALADGKRVTAHFYIEASRNLHAQIARRTALAAERRC